MVRHVALAFALAVLVAVAPAAADPAPAAFATLTPNTPATGTHLLLDARGAAGGWEAGQLPTGLTIEFQRGFTLDPTAVGVLCSDADADNDACPAESRIASGTLNVHATGLAFGANGQDFTADVALFLANPQQAGDPAGAVFSFRENSSSFHGASRGRIFDPGDVAYGTAIRFGSLPLPELPPGFHFDIQRLQLDLGAGAATPPAKKPSAKHKKRKKHRRKRHHRKKHHKQRHAQSSATGGALLTTPATCPTGAWSVRVQIDDATGPQVRDAAAPCKA